MLVLLGALISGCGATTSPDSYCLVTQEMRLERATVPYLIQNDRALLEVIIAHNEKRAALC